MARKKDTPQKAALREMMDNYLKGNNVKVQDGTDVNSIMRDMMSIILEGALDQEMDEELGYSKYDYRNKETDNSRNGHSQKTMHTSYGDMEIDIPRDRNFYTVFLSFPQKLCAALCLFRCKQYVSHIQKIFPLSKITSRVSSS